MRGCRVPYGPSRGTVTRMVSRAVWPVAGYGDEDGVACRIARRRIACGIARRLMASRPVPARVGDQCVPAMPTVRMPGGHTPMSPSAEPRSARTDLPSSVSECGKTGDPHRPCRTVTTAHRSPPGIVRASSGQNGTSWGRCTTGPPGRMREATRHKTRKKCAGTSPDITDHHQTSSDIIGHHRTSSGTRGLSRAVWPVAGYSDGDGSSRAVSSVAGSCAVGSVACRRARRRITCRRARREIASHHSAIRFGDLGVPAMPTVGHPEGPSSAMPRPNSACSRRRQPLCANIFSLVRRGASSLPVRRRG